MYANTAVRMVSRECMSVSGKTCMLTVPAAPNLR